jgi:hypothetical protein
LHNHDVKANGQHYNDDALDDTGNDDNSLTAFALYNAATTTLLSISPPSDACNGNDDTFKKQPSTTLH